MERLRNNSRLIVAGLITAGVLALVVSGNDSPSELKTDKPNEQTQSQSTDDTSKEAKEEPAAADEPIGAQPSAGPVSVDKEETNYKTTVRTGDNQSVIVRQMVNEYLKDNSKSLSAEQRLYIETNVVNTLPRNNKIYAGQEISVSKSVLADFVDKSALLTDGQLALWAQYL